MVNIKIGETRKINIKNRFYYFYNDINYLKNFDAKLLKIDRLRTKTLNPLNLHIIHARGYIEETNGNKYLIFDSVNENKEALKKYFEIWDGVKNKMKAINGDQCDYGEDYMKIKFNSDDDLPFNEL